jgi:O-antigen/teichoic acid export membrane protein
LVLAGKLMVFGRIGGTIFCVHGRLTLMIRLTVLGVAVRVTLLLVLVPRFGLKGAALAAGAAVMFEQIIHVVFAMQHFNVRVAALWQQNWRTCSRQQSWPVSYGPRGLAG